MLGCQARASPLLQVPFHHPWSCVTQFLAASAMAVLVFCVRRSRLAVCSHLDRELSGTCLRAEAPSEPFDPASLLDLHTADFTGQRTGSHSIPAKR